MTAKLPPSKRWKHLRASPPARTPKPEPDFGVIYRERLRELARNFADGEDADEPRARAYDFSVEACRLHHGVDLATAKRAVLAAIGRPVEREKA